MCAALALVARSADAAAPAPRVLFVRSPGDEPVVVRLYAEFAALRWHIIERRADASLDYAVWLRQARATAALRVLSLSTVDLWFLRPDADGVSLERITLAAPRAEGLLAVRVVETLRARLRVGTETFAAAEPAPAEPSAKAAREPSDTGPLNFWINAAPVVSWSPGGVGTLLHAALSLRYELSAPLAINAFGWAPLTTVSLRVAEGRLDLSGALFGGKLDLAWNSEPWGLTLGVGAAAAVLDVVGHAEPPYRGARSTAVTTLPLATLSVFHQFAGALRLRAEGLGGYSLPVASVNLRQSSTETDSIASWGAPLVAFNLGVEVGM